MKLRMIFLLLTAVLLAACGLENVDVTVGEPERLGEQGVATVVPESKPTNPAPAEPADTKPSDTFMPKVSTFAEGDDPVWGDAFCPTTMPLCIRPFAIESQGNEQVLRVEMWGTGDIFAAGSEKLSINWRAFDNDGEDHTGNVCGRSTKRAASYQAGFGHLSHICFNMETRPNRLEIQVNGSGNSFKLAMSVDAGNQEPVGGYSYAVGAKPLPLDEPFMVGPATVTIHTLDDRGDYLVIELSIQAPTGEKVLVDSPDWIVVGSVISFHTVDEMGVRSGWDEAKMRAYETVGGEVAAGETQTGVVVLTKADENVVLLINYGPSTALDTDAAIFLLNH